MGRTAKLCHAAPGLPPVKNTAAVKNATAVKNTAAVKNVMAVKNTAVVKNATAVKNAAERPMNVKCCLIEPAIGLEEKCLKDTWILLKGRK